MSAPKVTRKTRNSRKHLASDFDWEGLEGLDFPATDLLPERHGMIAQQSTTSKPLKFDSQLFAFPSPGDILTIPDSRPLSSSSKAVKAKKTDVTNVSLDTGALDKTNRDLQRLTLLQKTHKLEIRKFELQLELAKISSPTQQAVKSPNTADESFKSMGDLEAPQRTRFPQPWPHIYAPGEPQLFSELLLLAFCTGYIAILQQHKDTSSNIPYDGLLSHFHDLMVLACNYKWSAVSVYHYKILRSLELGLVKWGDSFLRSSSHFSFLPPYYLTIQQKKQNHQPSHRLLLSPAWTSAMLGPGTTIAAAHRVLNFMSALSANAPTTAPTTAPNASSPFPLATKTQLCATD